MSVLLNCDSYLENVKGIHFFFEKRKLIFSSRVQPLGQFVCSVRRVGLHFSIALETATSIFIEG